MKITWQEYLEHIKIITPLFDALTGRKKDLDPAHGNKKIKECAENYLSHIQDNRFCDFAKMIRKICDIIFLLIYAI